MKLYVTPSFDNNIKIALFTAAYSAHVYTAVKELKMEGSILYVLKLFYFISELCDIKE